MLYVKNLHMKEQAAVSRGADLGKGSIGKLLFQLALPAITAQIINLLYNLVDRMYIGHIPKVGALALTGVGVTLPVIMIIAAFAALIGSGGAPRASIFMGQKDPDKAEETLGNSVTALVIISITLTIIFQIFSEPILMVFGASTETVQYAKEYMNIYVWGTIFVQIALGLNLFITSQGFAKVSMKTVIIGAVLNIILDPIFIFGFGMGVKGAALATVLAQAVSAIWVLRFLLGNQTHLKIKKKYLKLNKKIILPVLALGVSPFIMQATESLIAVCFNTSLLKFGGNVAVGAMTILTSCMQFSLLPLMGLTQGMQPIVSFNYGARNVDRVKKAFRLTLISAVSYTGFLWVLFMVCPGVFARIFTSDPVLIEYTIWALRIYMAVTGIFGIQIACQQTFIALGNAKVSLFLAVLRKILILIPMIFVLPFFFENKSFAVFLAEPVTDFIAVSVTITMFTFHFKKAMKQIECPQNIQEE